MEHTSGTPTGGEALARMTEMQALLEQVQRDEAEFDGLADRLAAYFARVDRLRDYLDRWLEDREEILGAAEGDGTGDDDEAGGPGTAADAGSGRPDGSPHLPILGEDPLWESLEAASELVRATLTVCAAEVAAERELPEE